MLDFALYSIITPDGETFDLAGDGVTVGIGDIQDGMGLPPVGHDTWELYNSPGAHLRAVRIQPRLVTISVSLNSSCLAGLHALRNKLWQACRWNRTLDNPPAPARLRYTLGGKSADLYVYYSGDVTARLGGSNVAQLCGLKLVAYDPLWYNPTEVREEGILADSATFRIVAAKLAGQWSELGPPNAAGTYTFVSAFAEDDAYIYVGGDFLNFDNIANADYIVRYNKATGAWSALGTGMNGMVNCLAIAPDGTLWAGGGFTTAGGVACGHIAAWDPISQTWSNVGDTAGGGIQFVFDIAISETGIVYACGDWTSIGGVAANYVAYRTGGVWNAMGVGVDNETSAIRIGKNGYVYLGGHFHNAGGAGAMHIAVWNGTAWAPLGAGTNGPVYTISVSENGLIYAGGNFTTAGGGAANYIASWNGVAWTALGLGVTSTVFSSYTGADGKLYVSGNFTSAGGLALVDRVAAWNGTAWEMLDINLPGNPTAYAFLVSQDGNLWIGFDTTGTGYFSSPIVAAYTGDYESFPIFTVTGPGTFQSIINETSGDQLLFNLYINAGETITIDLSDGVKGITSSWPTRPGAFAGLSLPQSDLGAFSLKPEPIAPLGANTVSVFMTGTTPVDFNDGSAQLDHYENMTGITCLNTGDNGVLYVSVIADGGGFYHIEFYTDAARTLLVAHTATYNAIGAKAIVADNASGIGGTVTADAVGPADADIYVYFATVCMTYFNRFLSVDAAIQ